MSAAGLDVFDKTLQMTHTWLEEIGETIGPDRQVAWHVLGAVLCTLRDRLPLGLAAHLGAQLPLLVRDLYYDQWHLRPKPLRLRSARQFLEEVHKGLGDIRPVDPEMATRTVFQVLNHYLDPGQVQNVRDALSEPIRRLWPDNAEVATAENRRVTENIQTLKEGPVKIQDMMTKSVRIASPSQPIREVARVMAEIDAGVLPVAQDDRLVGMITDRDIVVRAVAEGKAPETPVRDIMSPEVRYCFADQDLADVAANMGEIKVRRLPVMDRNKRLVGIVSLGDVALADSRGQASGAALSAVSVPGGEHSQATEAR